MPRLRAGERVIISAHGNSLRALEKHLSNIADDDIVGLEIPTGQPIVYELGDDLAVHDRYYLSERLAARSATCGAASHRTYRPPDFLSRGFDPVHRLVGAGEHCGRRVAALDQRSCRSPPTAASAARRTGIRRRRRG